MIRHSRIAPAALAAASFLFAAAAAAQTVASAQTSAPAAQPSAPTAAQAAIAHVFSTYEARRKADDTQLLARGINSIQLFNDGTRWWIVSIYWQAERPDTQIPAQYLPKGR